MRRWRLLQERLDVLTLALLALAREVPTDRTAAAQDIQRRQLAQRLE
jgi:hypothetical protein